jgi:serine/threonine-protein kinase
VASQCPKCQTDNPDILKYCGECGTQIITSDDVSPSVTKTLETHTRRLALGSIFARRYEILEELGKGGMGEVYRVKDKTLEEEMALKVLKPEIAAYKGTIERFKNELKLARKIAHKHVCKMYDLNEEKETPFITMEYVKGTDLKSFIRKKERLKEEEVIAIAKQVCEGLAGAHELGVIHRDLKPQNIMIDKEGQLKIMDFGIARSVEEEAGSVEGVSDYPA